MSLKTPNKEHYACYRSLVFFKQFNQRGTHKENYTKKEIPLQNCVCQNGKNKSARMSYRVS